MIGLALLGSVRGTVASAQDLSDQRLEQSGLAEQPTVGDWNITLGGGVGAGPDYLGAKDYRVEVIPIASITYRDWLGLGPAGLRATLIDWNGFRAGPVIGFMGGRDQSDDSHLNGLGDIQTSLTGGIFASYRLGPFGISATARQAATHSENGFVGLLSLSYRTELIPKTLELEIGPELSFGDAQYDRTWFGVSPSQSAASGLPTFTPGGGLTDAGIQASLTYHWSDHILVRGFADIKELTGDSADSPIVQDKTQARFGMGVAYHF